MLFSTLVMKNVVYFMKNVVNSVNYFRQFCFYFSDNISLHRILLHCESIFETSILFSILHSILLYILYIFCTFVLFFIFYLFFFLFFFIFFIFIFFHALIFMSYTSLRLMLSV